MRQQRALLTLIPLLFISLAGAGLSQPETPAAASPLEFHTAEPALSNTEEAAPDPRDEAEEVQEIPLLAGYDRLEIVTESGYWQYLSEDGVDLSEEEKQHTLSGMRVLQREKGVLDGDPQALFTLIGNGMMSKILIMEFNGKRDYLFYEWGGIMDDFTLADLDGDGSVEVLTSTIFNGAWSGGIYRCYRLEDNAWRCIFDSGDVQLDLKAVFHEGYQYTVTESFFGFEDSFVRKAELENGTILFFDEGGNPTQEDAEYRLVKFLEFMPMGNSEDGTSDVFASVRLFYGYIDMLGEYMMLFRYSGATGKLEPVRSALWVPEIPDDEELIEKEKHMEIPPPEPNTYTKPSFGRYWREYERQRTPFYEAFLEGTQ